MVSTLAKAQLCLLFARLSEMPSSPRRLPHLFWEWREDCAHTQGLIPGKAMSRRHHAEAGEALPVTPQAGSVDPLSAQTGSVLGNLMQLKSFLFLRSCRGSVLTSLPPSPCLSPSFPASLSPSLSLTVLCPGQGVGDQRGFILELNLVGRKTWPESY